MYRIVAVSLISLALLTGCANSSETPQAKESAMEPAESYAPSASENAVPKVEVVPPTPKLDTSIYATLDAECGTSLADSAEVIGDSTSGSVNALFVGTKSLDLQKLECILGVTQSSVTIDDLETGVDLPVPSTSDAGSWAIQGNISPLGEDSAIFVNLYFLPAS